MGVTIATMLPPKRGLGEEVVDEFMFNNLRINRFKE
jgi:hypothetical protein